MSYNTILYALYRLGYHGRATVLAERWHQPGLTKWVSGHEEKNAVRAAYNRAEYLNERRAMMNQWADYMDALSGGNIVPFNANTKVR